MKPRNAGFLICAQLLKYATISGSSENTIPRLQEDKSKMKTEFVITAAIGGVLLFVVLLRKLRQRRANPLAEYYGQPRGAREVHEPVATADDSERFLPVEREPISETI